MKAGCYTALITPFTNGQIDWDGMERLVNFQLENGITGILAAGTTGESPVLNWEEHNQVIEFITRKAKNKCRCIAGTGSNNTKETMEAIPTPPMQALMRFCWWTPTTTAPVHKRSAKSMSHR